MAMSSSERQQEQEQEQLDVTHETLQGLTVAEIGLLCLPPVALALVCVVCSVKTRREQERRLRREQERMAGVETNNADYVPGEDCPICMEPSSYGCETMCGHAFCTLCLSTYWKSLPQGTSRPLNCPYCRRQVTLLVANFSPEELANVETTRLRQAELDEYNSMHGGGRDVGPIQYLTHMRVLLTALAREFARRPVSIALSMVATAYRLRRGLSLLLSVLYVISPVDLLPEAVLGVVGLIDDFVVIMFILVVVAGLYEAMVLARARREE
mmetsp:Transcript_108709/g.316283  ORF Transcript_108709/g.316283 Transcript_108709/m.316283 type:complete len:269 (+) Transcript_108709:226-1032(+)